MGQRILIVDDDPDALDLIGLILRRHGYEPVGVPSGAEALQFLAHDVPDLIVLDVMMPGLDGNAVCQQIRADSRTASIPVVMLTARSGTANQIEGLMSGADDYLVKPFSTDELITSVEATLARATPVADKKYTQVISVLGARGGVGATTLAVNLAVTLAARLRVVLADFEPGGTAALHLGLTPVRGLNDLLASPTDALDLPTIQAALTPHTSGLSLLGASTASVDTARASAILTHLRDAFDVCVFDLGAGLSPLVQALAPRSNILALALDADRVTLAQAKHIIRGAKEAESPWPELKFVRINRQGAPDSAAQAAIQSAFGQDVAVIGSASEAMYQALETGQPLVTGQPDHPVAVQIRALAELLISTEK